MGAGSPEALLPFASTAPPSPGRAPAWVLVSVSAWALPQTQSPTDTMSRGAVPGCWGPSPPCAALWVRRGIFWGHKGQFSVLSGHTQAHSARQGPTVKGLALQTGFCPARGAEQKERSLFAQRNGAGVTLKAGYNCTGPRHGVPSYFFTPGRQLLNVPGHCSQLQQRAIPWLPT